MISEGKMLLDTQGIALWLVENDVVKNLIGSIKTVAIFLKEPIKVLMM